MLIDDVQSDIMRELARIHKRKMAPRKRHSVGSFVPDDFF